jgi:hypothetical protein
MKWIVEQLWCRTRPQTTSDTELSNNGRPNLCRIIVIIHLPVPQKLVPGWFGHGNLPRFHLINEGHWAGIGFLRHGHLSVCKCDNFDQIALNQRRHNHLRVAPAAPRRMIAEQNIRRSDVPGFGNVFISVFLVHTRSFGGPTHV